MSEQFDVIVIGMGPGGRSRRCGCWTPGAASRSSREACRAALEQLDLAGAG